MRTNGFIISIFITFLSLNSFAQKLTRFSWPHISNYTKQEYNAENHNWSIAQDSKGNMYFGNHAGLLKFNGQSWELFSSPNHGIIRSVAIDSNNRIYVGSYEEFGFWETNKYGELKYHSLKTFLDDYSFHNEEIWKIIIQGDNVYFQAFSKIFIYNGKQIKIISPSGIISSFSNVQNRLLIQIADKGLFEIKEDKLNLIDDSDLFTKNSLRAILPYNNNEYLIASYEKGTYLYNTKNKLMRPWNPSFSSIFHEEKINRALKTSDGKYIIGTILDGIYIFNSNGKFIQKINQHNGLQNNTVLSLFKDVDGQLWVGLDTGIDIIHLNSDVSFFKDPHASIGTVYSTIIHNNLLYVGTNRGLYASEINIDEDTGIANLDFQLINNSQDQVWYLSVFDGELFCGHNKGTFKVNKLDVKLVSKVTGGLSMIKFSKNNEDYLLQGTYTNLVIYKHENNKWQFSHTINNFQHPAKYLEIDHLNNIWVGHLLKGLYKLKLNDDLTSVINNVFLNNNDVFQTENAIVNVSKFKNRVYFTTDGKTYTYNDFTDSIINYNLLSEDMPINKIIPVNDDYCWIVSDNHLAYYRFTDSIPILLDIYSFSLFNNELTEDNEYIFPIDTTKSIICMNEGLALINRQLSNQKEQSIKQVSINRVVSSGSKQILLKINRNSYITPPVLSYNQNTLTFHYSYPQYLSKVSFKVKLEGLDTAWMEINSNIKKYERLPYNTYTFKVIAVNENGLVSQIQAWPFIIMPPFYFTRWAYFMYAFLFITLLYFIRKYYRKRLQSQEKSLRGEKEKALIRMRNDLLRSEIQQKTEQLADTTFTIIKKNELLMQIKRLLINNRKSETYNRQINNTIRLIERNISHGDDWKIFENNFEQAHREFLSRIKESYPDLSPNDLKLCAFLRMNLSSKKIGSLLGISTRSVENHRYRIRKKLNLDHDANLTDFIMSF